MIVATFNGNHPGDLSLDGSVTRVAVVTDWGYRVEISEEGIKIWDSANRQISDFRGSHEVVDRQIRRV